MCRNGMFLVDIYDFIIFLHQTLHVWSLILNKKSNNSTDCQLAAILLYFLKFSIITEFWHLATVNLFQLYLFLFFFIVFIALPRTTADHDSLLFTVTLFKLRCLKWIRIAEIQENNNDDQKRTNTYKRN